MTRFVLVASVFLWLIVGPAVAEADSKPVAVPFDLLITKHIVVQIKINGKGPYRVIFDTGAPVTLFSTKIAWETELVDKKSRRPGFGLFAGPDFVKVKTLQIGDLTAENIPVIVMDHPTLEAIAQVLGPIEGILGFPFFARYRMTLDYQAKRMTFVPNGYDPPDVLQAMLTTVMTMSQNRQPAAKVLAPAALWGFVVHKEADDADAGVPIKEVFPGSAAARAGLKPGDRLLTLDGRWTDTVSDTYRAAAEISARTETVVRIRRGEQEMELTVVPTTGL
jgi:membrane-associated protease RseP (regulator of RpoE activity)